ncbi:PQQ-binding-like beta-propeller repeat protein [Mycolicibacterium mucogenicum]|uniref:Rv3212 family protein n=1 Tax=Mycolicibacterium TaxID=1866885 RepID=UPI002269E090|nr:MULTISPECIES: PQQ-binding-like beta-propeller repeat protein [Mycolicibacterium]MCX8562537.1 PQQ-binding-like beta-propeller repeat protein [Mycolicibacterium mucogenicum]
MVKPERRTKADLIAAAAIVVVVAVGAALIWWNSDARATVSRPADRPVPALHAAKTVPTTLRELWTAASGKTTQPAVVGGVVVTGDGDEMLGRDPATGSTLWSYSRGRELCGVTTVYQFAVAVYPDGRGCGQASAIDASTGRRGPARSSLADAEVKLSTDGTTILSYGDSRLEQWRSDLVRMISYGYLDAVVKPGVPASPLCRLTSAAASPASVAVMEACPKQNDLRLTLLKAAKEEDQPDVKRVALPGVGVDSDAQVIAVSETKAAIYVPTPQPCVNIIDETGNTIASTLLPHPPTPVTATTRVGDVVTWYTGDSVLVFDANGLRYKYTVSAQGGQAPIGPATMLAGHLLVPVTSGYDTFDAQSGAGQTHIALARPPVNTAVIPALAGSVLLEQRGSQLVALGQ